MDAQASTYRETGQTCTILLDRMNSINLFYNSNTGKYFWHTIAEMIVTLFKNRSGLYIFFNTLAQYIAWRENNKEFKLPLPYPSMSSSLSLIPGGSY